MHETLLNSHEHKRQGWAVNSVIMFHHKPDRLQLYECITEETNLDT